MLRGRLQRGVLIDVRFRYQAVPRCGRDASEAHEGISQYVRRRFTNQSRAGRPGAYRLQTAMRRHDSGEVVGAIRSE